MLLYLCFQDSFKEMVVVVERILVGLNYSSKIMVKYKLKLLMVLFRYLLNIGLCGVYEDGNEWIW